jgi:hypothetical protein
MISMTAPMKPVPQRLVERTLVLMPMVMDGLISMMRLMMTPHNGQMLTVMATVITLRGQHPMIAPTKQGPRPWIGLAVLMRMKMVIQTLMASG